MQVLSSAAEPEPYKFDLFSAAAEASQEQEGHPSFRPSRRQMDGNPQRIYTGQSAGREWVLVLLPTGSPSMVSPETDYRNIDAGSRGSTFTQARFEARPKESETMFCGL